MEIVEPHGRGLDHLFDSGKVLHVDSSEVRVFGNPMYGIPHPEQPNRSMHR